MKLLYKSLLFLMIFICSVGSVCATDPDNNVADLDSSLSDVNSNVTVVNDSNNINNSDLVINTTVNSNSNLYINNISIKTKFKKGDIIQNGKVVNELYPSFKNFRKSMVNKTIATEMKKLLDETCKKENLEKKYKSELKLLSDKILLNLYNLDYVINESLTLNEKDLYNKMKLFNSSNHYYSLSELYNNDCSDSNKNLNKSVIRIDILIKNCLKSIEKYMQTIDSHNKELKEYLPNSFKSYKDKLSFVKEHYPDSDLKELVNITENTIGALNSRISYLNILSNHLNCLKTDLERTKNIIRAKYNMKG